MCALGYLLLATLACAPASAQEDWPSRPLRLVVPSSPGGGTDTYARVLSQALVDQLHQQIVIDNRPGASGNIGTEIVARAAGDGYTFLVSANAAITVNPALYPSLPFDMDRDFAPVTRGVSAALALIVPATSTNATLRDLIADARQNPGRLAFGSAGNGSPTYLGVRLIGEAAGVSFLHVPYKGIGPALQGLLSGELAFLFPDLTGVIPHLRSGRLRALAISEHSPLFPDVPTLAESGLPGVRVWGSFSVLAPASTSRDIVQRMNNAVARAMKQPALAEKLRNQGLVPVFDTPEDFAASLRAEREHWAGLIRRNHISADD